MGEIEGVVVHELEERRVRFEGGDGHARLADAP